MSYWLANFIFLSPPTVRRLLCASQCTQAAVPLVKVRSSCFIFSVRKCSPISFIFTRSREETRGSCWQMMSFCHVILNELFTGKLYLSLPSYCSPFVMCQSLYTSIGPANQGTVQLLQNFSMKIKSDFIHFYWIKREEQGVLACKWWASAM